MLRLAAAAIFKSYANRALEKNMTKKTNALKVFFIELPFMNSLLLNDWSW